MSRPSSIPAPYNEPVLSYAPGSKERQSIASELSRFSRQSSSSEALDIPCVIGGEKIYLAKKQSITAPHNHLQEVCLAQETSAQHIEQAIAASLQATHLWGSMHWRDRVGVFLKAADLLSGPYRSAVVAATMLSQSKTVIQAELDACCEAVDFLRFQASYCEDIHAFAPHLSAVGEWNQLEARPLEGFVFAIGPFNFTAISMNLACAPAMMGCTVLWKPAPEALRASYICLEALHKAGLPPGVINLVSGDPQMISEIALAHPSLAGVHFTGSTQTFCSIWQRVGERISQYRNYPRIVGETGGKGFVFAHPSANPEHLMFSLIRGAFEYQGQKCSAASRAYLPESLFANIKEPLLEHTLALPMGDVAELQNFLGAVINERAYKKITSYVDFAYKAEDCTVLCGGSYDDSKGYFVQPTIVQTTSLHSKLMLEEIFGPILTIYVYPDQDWLKMAKECGRSSAYALTGAIFARSRDVIATLSHELRYAAGNIYINDKPTGAVVGQQPFGGSRASGTNDKAGSSLLLQRWVSYRTIKERFTPLNTYSYPSMETSS